MKKGRFGIYFYDKQMNINIDLNKTLEKLNKLDMINKILKINNEIIILCKNCLLSSEKCCQSKFNLENNITFDYCNEFKIN